MHRNRRIRGILKSNKGSSLILVAALTVVIIGLAVSLRILSGIIMASANQQLNQDQAYELATSLGNSLEERILNVGDDGKPLLDLQSYITNNKDVVNMSGFDGMPEAAVVASVKKDAAGRYVLTIRSRVGKETDTYKAVYVWTGIYAEKTAGGYEKCAE